MLTCSPGNKGNRSDTSVHWTSLMKCHVLSLSEDILQRLCPKHESCQWCVCSKLYSYMSIFPHRQSEGVKLQSHCALPGRNLTFSDHRNCIHHEDNGLVIRWCLQVCSLLPPTTSWAKVTGLVKRQTTLERNAWRFFYPPYSWESKLFVGC